MGRFYYAMVTAAYVCMIYAVCIVGLMVLQLVR